MSQAADKAQELVESYAIICRRWHRTLQWWYIEVPINTTAEVYKQTIRLIDKLITKREK